MTSGANKYKLNRSPDEQKFKKIEDNMTVEQSMISYVNDDENE